MQTMTCCVNSLSQHTFYYEHILITTIGLAESIVKLFYAQLKFFGLSSYAHRVGWKVGDKKNRTIAAQGIIELIQIG